MLSSLLQFPRKSHRKIITFPPESAKLAELMGIVFGDGGIGNFWQLVISLNSEKDKDYAKYVIGLLQDLFAIKVVQRKRPNQNTLVLVINVLALMDPKIDANAATSNIFINVFGYFDRVVTATRFAHGITDLPLVGGRDLQQIISNLFAPNKYANLGIFPPSSTTGWLGVSCDTFVLGFIACIPQNVSSIMSGVISYIISWAIGALAAIVIFIAILVSLLRLWLQLIQAYFFILLDVVTAPFWIVISAFPGSKNGFELWVRDMLGWLAAFPIVVALFLFGKVLIDIFQTTNVNTLFVAPLIGNPNGQSSTVGGANNNPIGGILAIAIVLIAPQAIKISRDTFKSPNIPYVAGVFQSVGIGVKAVSGMIKTVVGAATQQEIEYDNATGAIKPIQNRLKRLQKRVGKSLFGG